MISNTLYYGSIAMIIVSVVLPVGCIIFSFKKGGTKGMPLFLLIGLAASMLMSSLGGIISGVALPAEIVDVSVVLYLVLSALLFTIMDTGAKFLSIQISKKTGMGFYKAFTLGTGYVAGKFLMNTNLYLSLSTGIKTFQEYSLEEVIDMQFKQNMEQDLVKLTEDLTAMRDGLMTTNPFTYFIEALGICSIIFLDIVLILMLVRFLREKKIVQGIGIVAGIRFVFSILESLIKNLPLESMDEAISEETSLILSVVLYVIIIAFSIFFIKKLYHVLPKEEKSGESISPLRQQRIDAEKQAEKKAWSEFRNVNVRNIKSIEERAAEENNAGKSAQDTDDTEDEDMSQDDYEEDSYIEEPETEEKPASRSYLDEDDDEA